MFLSLDMFSSTFLFNVGLKVEQKKTKFGAILTCFIFGTSLAYLGYLASIYFQNQYLPRILSSDSVPFSTSFRASKTQIIFTMMINDMPHRAYSKEIGSNIVSYQIQYIEAQKDNNIPKMTNLNVVDCEEEQYKDYDCIDISDSNSLISQTPYGQVVLANNYLIWVFPCHVNGNNCASLLDTTTALSSPANHFYLLARVDQYDVSSKTFNQIYINFVYQLSQSLTIFSTISAQTQIYKITDGPFVQTTQYYQKIKSYNRVDGYFTQTDTIGSGLSLVGVIITVNQNYVTTEIQFPPITEILAQFTSVLNILFALGFLGRMTSKSNLYKQIKDVVIKNTFIGKYNNAIIHSNNPNIIDINKIHPFNNKNDSSEQQIISLSQDLKNSNNPEEMILRQVPQQEKKKLVEYFNQRTEQVLDVNELISSMMFMQRAIKLMLTKEQYVALKYCGQDICSSTDQKPTPNIQSDQFQGQLQSLDLPTPESEKLQDIDQVRMTPQMNAKSKLIAENNIELSGTSLFTQNNKNTIDNNHTKSNFNNHNDHNTQNTKQFQEQQEQQKQQHQLNYLTEIERLEQNNEEQQKILIDYLKQFKNQNTQNLSTTDYNIYSCIPKQ